MNDEEYLEKYHTHYAIQVNCSKCGEWHMIAEAFFPGSVCRQCGAELPMGIRVRCRDAISIEKGEPAVGIYSAEE